MILESIATTVDEDGRVNIAPLGPHVDGPDFSEALLFPFEGSLTCTNLLRSRRVTIHVTDDAALFAKSAVERICADDLVVPVQTDGGCEHWRLKDCHRWLAIEVVDVVRQGPKYRMPCRVVASGVVRPFFGFNRAKHALIEASILATRLAWIDREQVLAELDRLSLLVDKTAGVDEREAFDWLCQHVRGKLGA